MTVAVPVAADASVTGTVTHVTITNANKLWWPDDGLTKADVARHYARVADRLLPWTTDRPLTVERCPDGMLGRCFYQKNFASAMKLGVPTRRSEVCADLDPATLNLRTTPARLTRPDAWRGFWSDLQDLPGRAGGGVPPTRSRRRCSAA